MMDSIQKFAFSVSMCVYGGDNVENFNTALESVFVQTRIPDEVVLVIDGPIPDSINNVVQSFQEKYEQLKVVRLEENQGHGIARRVGISNCTKPYIAIADADDINLPERFETQIRRFEENPNLDVVGAAHSKFIGDDNNIVAISSRPEKHDDIIRLMKSKCPVTQACVMFSKKIYDASGGYIDWYCAEDYYLWIRMYEAGAIFYNCPEILLKVRTSGDQYKRRGGWKYFKSTMGISKYMYKKKIIGWKRHVKNVVPRFVLQVLMPSWLRGIVRNKMIRRSTKKLEG